MIKRPSRPLVAALAGVCLALGSAGVAQAAGSPGHGPKVTVTESTTSFTATDSNIGSLTFGVDPSTGAISSPSATPDTGYTASTPSVSGERVEVTFTPTSGRAVTLIAQALRSHGEVVVTAHASKRSKGKGGMQAIGQRGHSRVTVTEAPTSFTATDASIGSLSFTFDESSASFSGVSATAAGGYSAGTPVTSGRSVDVAFTNGSSKSVTLVAKVVVRDGSILAHAHVSDQKS